MDLNPCLLSCAAGMDNDAGNRAKELGDDYAGIFFSADIVDRVRI